MKRLALVAVLLAGCSESLLSQCETAQQSYDVVQVGILTAVSQAQTPPDVKADLKVADLAAVAGLNQCLVSARSGDAKGVSVAVQSVSKAASKVLPLVQRIVINKAADGGAK